MRHPLLVPDLRELIHDGEIAGLRDFFADYHPGRVAELMEDLETDEGDALFGSCRRETAPKSSATSTTIARPAWSRRCRPRRRPNSST